MNATVKQYLESLKEDITGLDLFCDDELSSVFCHFVLLECISVLEDIKHPESSHNSIIDNKIGFIKETLKECEKYNINKGFNSLKYLEL